MLVIRDREVRKARNVKFRTSRFIGPGTYRKLDDVLVFGKNEEDLLIFSFVNLIGPPQTQTDKSVCLSPTVD